MRYVLMLGSLVGGCFLIYMAATAGPTIPIEARAGVAGASSFFWLNLWYLASLGRRG